MDSNLNQNQKYGCLGCRNWYGTKGESNRCMEKHGYVLVEGKGWLRKKASTT